MQRRACGLIPLLLAALLIGSPAHAQKRAQPQAKSVSAAPSKPFVAGGANDPDTPEAAVVVSLFGANNIFCSGTLITPMAVITANHCINGTDNAAGTNKPGPGMSYPIQIVVRTGGTSTANYTSNNITRTKTLGGVPQKAEDYGQDVAVVFLDPPGARAAGSANYLPGPAASYAQIVHPSLTAPCPTSGCSGDGDGGSYNPPFGMAGFAPQDSHPFRQVAYDSQYNHFPGNPDVKGQYWRHDQGSIHDDAGDSGGALFVRRPLPGVPGGFYRDLLGVISGESSSVCFEGKCDHDVFTDITRGDPANWLRASMIDPTPRGPNWKRMHPNYTWYGDLDYTGPCNTARDSDCDHWYNEHDNCPNVANPNQNDANDDGIGDACLPSPPTAGPTCRINSDCTGAVWASCPAEPNVVTLQDLRSGAWQTIASASPPYPQGVFMKSGPNILVSSSSGTFRACENNVSGQSCDANQTVAGSTIAQCTPGSSGGGTGGTGTGGGGGGGHRGPVRQ